MLVVVLTHSPSSETGSVSNSVPLSLSVLTCQSGGLDLMSFKATFSFMLYESISSQPN